MSCASTPCEIEDRIEQLDKPYRDEEILNHLYHEKELTVNEISDRLNCGYRTVYDWINRLEIGTRKDPTNYLKENPPWQDEDTLVRLYSDQKLSTREIAEELGCSNDTVLRWMRNYGIEPRDRIEATKKSIRKKPTSFVVNHEGYEHWRCGVDGERYRVCVHRLLAVAKYGFDEVVGQHVHHKNKVPWDNREENIGILSPSEHLRLHGEDRELPRDERGRFE